MARRAAGGGGDFSFVSPVVKYVLFLFNALFWVSAGPGPPRNPPGGCLGSPPAAAVACLAVDPAILLVVVGVLTFLITFCGCVGSLRENICLLQAFSVCLTVIFLLQLAAGVLGFVFSDKARGKVSEIINGAIVHYRDDLDLQNLIDFGQKEFSCCGGVSYKDWSQNMYFNCTATNPSRERCSVPFSCCLRDADEVRMAASAAVAGRPPLRAPSPVPWGRAEPGVPSPGEGTHHQRRVGPPTALRLRGSGLVGILLAQILISQVRDQIKLQLYNQQHRADPWY
ncbi:TSN33 protein, partial [Cochlearius cochlearius]|nr:TSN33 protein [Cochlearius cochlearius]